MERGVHGRLCTLGFLICLLQFSCGLCKLSTDQPTLVIGMSIPTFDQTQSDPSNFSYMTSLRGINLKGVNPNSLSH